MSGDAEIERDPTKRLARWLEEARKAGVLEPGAMTLATVGADGQPAARIVLLRGLDERGLRFYTSYTSRKGHELSANPLVAVVFYWATLERQARVEGPVRELSEDESDAYFATRPRGHRLAAWASEQSEPLENRQVIEERYAHFDLRFEDGEVPRPHSWGGYLIAPQRFEFWQGRPNRLHDRLEYVRAGRTWNLRRLQP